MSDMYFWDDENIIITESMSSRQVHHRHLDNHLCVDTSYTDPGGRYGIFISYGGWEQRPLSVFPPLFRTQLLLLGVS